MLEFQDSSWERLIGARLVAGDAAALAEAYERFASYVYSIARRVIRDPDQAAEVMQEVFCRLWARPGQFDADRGSLRAFLGVLTHRRAVDCVRRAEAARRADRGHQDRLDGVRPSGAGTSAYGIDDVADEVATSIVATRVHDAVGRLPDHQRNPIVLAYFEGRTFTEVAEILDIPEGTAKSRIRAALDKLSHMLDSSLVGS